jgi:tetratricopeptide (TPR) repeat protein
VATTLNNLARLYHDQGKHAEAEPLYKRALGIVEKTSRPGHPDMLMILDNIVEFYREVGKCDDAKRYEKRAKKIR